MDSGRLHRPTGGRWSLDSESDRVSSSSAVELLQLMPSDAGPERNNIQRADEAVSSNLTKIASKPETSLRHLQREAAMLPPASLDEPSMLQRYLLDTWVCEIAALTFSIGCTVVIAALASSYNGKSATKLPRGVTLNTMIAVLSTSARSALMFVVSAVIGQLKWFSLRKSSRKLQDIQAVDEASRGALGAFKTLVTWTGGPLTALGSMVVLLLIAFGPFLQKLVEYPTHDVESIGQRATIPQSFNYTVLKDADQPEDYPEVGSAVRAGLNFDPDIFSMRVSRPTAHCSWNTFKSVGWCSKCEDVTESTVVENCALGPNLYANATRPFCQVTLPIEKGDDAYTLNSTFLASFRGSHINGLDYVTESIWHMRRMSERTLNYERIEVNGVSSPSVVFAYVAMTRVEEVLKSFSSGDPEPLRLESASRCILTLCEREYNATTLDGVTDVALLGVNYGNLTRPYFDTLDQAGNRSRGNLTCWQPEPGNVTFTSLDGNLTFLNQDKRAFCPVSIYGYYLADILPFNNSMTWYNATSHLDSNLEALKPFRFRNISAQMERVAAALTSYGLSLGNDTHLGTAYVSETFVRVRWWWISFPALLQLASVVLLSLTILHSRLVGAPLWKSSLLAVYYHQVGDLELKDDPFVEKLSGMEVAARNTVVSFR